MTNINQAAADALYDTSFSEKIEYNQQKLKEHIKNFTLEVLKDLEFNAETKGSLSPEDISKYIEQFKKL